MDELLAQALADFEDSPVALKAPELEASGRRHDSVGNGAATALEQPSTSATSRGPLLPPQTKRNKPIDPLKTTAHGDVAPSAWGQPDLLSGKQGLGPQLPPRTKKSQSESTRPELRPDVHKLADDLFRLMEESGLGDDGGAQGAGGLPNLGQLGSLDFASSIRAFAEQAEAGVAGSSGNPTSETIDSFRSAALRGLAEQTKHTVDKQSKFSRGEGQASASTQKPEGAAAAGFPFGDLLGGLAGMGGAGGEGGGGMDAMVGYIMQNLLSKEVLYGPLKEIRDKYPPWLEANRAAMLPEDLQRYTAQYASIQAVCQQYEEDPANFQKLVDLIQQMQKHGDPPSEIVDEMTGGMPPGLMGAAGTGDPEDIGNFDMPDDFTAGLPQELQDKCSIQ